MRRLLTALALLAASAAFAPAPVKPAPPPKAPTIRFVGAVALEEYTLLRFEVSNPGGAPLHYIGYAPDREDREAGIIVPLYAVEIGDGKEWKPCRVRLAILGATKVPLSAGDKGVFNVLAPSGDWKEVKVGLRCDEGKKILWSAPISRDDARAPRK